VSLHHCSGKMKPIILLILCILVLSCNHPEPSVTELKIGRIENLTNLEQGRFDKPCFGIDSAALFFTGTGNRGLWKLNIRSQKLSQLNGYQGAGDGFLIDQVHNTVIFRIDSTNSKRRRIYQIIKQDPATGIKIPLAGPSRYLSHPLYLKNNILFYMENDQLQIQDLESGRMVKDALPEFVFYNLHENKIVQYSNDGKTNWQPFSPEDLLVWLDVHPDKPVMLVYVAGKGTYQCDWRTRTTAFFCAGRAAVYSPDGKYVAYMLDQDDGQVITASDIYIASTDTTRVLNVTNSPDPIEIYPRWSPDGTLLTFQTLEGQIKVANLVFNKGE